ncbi:MAG: hypothetical protein OEX08_02515 [Candidatus Nomurabacteria bacterium]|nr:hypothetical protein [Candidatus Nomurabacteria bacterium]
MDQDFQTTFIPKKPTMSAPATKKRRSRPVGLLMMLAVLLVILAGASAGGVVVYEQLAQASLDEKRESLKVAEGVFETSLLAELQKLDNRLESASMLLDNHIMMEPLFRMLELTTLPDVRFSQFNFSQADGPISLKLAGEATNYTAIAQQSAIFGEEDMVSDHVFSNFSPNNDGGISFDISMKINRSFLLAERVAKRGRAVSQPEPILPEPLDGGTNTPQ